MAAIEALLILFLMGALGWVLRARGLVTPAAMPALSAIALNFALPCLVFVVILNRFQPGNMPGWYALLGAWVLLTLIALPLSLLAGLAARPALRHDFRLCCFHQNALIFFLAILTEMFEGDSTAVARMFLMTFLFPVFFFKTYAMFFRAGRPGGLAKEAPPGASDHLGGCPDLPGRGHEPGSACAAEGHAAGRRGLRAPAHDPAGGADPGGL